MSVEVLYTSPCDTYYKDDSSEPVQDAPEDPPEDPPEDAPEENHDQRAPEGDYDSDIIIIDIL